MRTFQAHRKDVYGLAFAPDGHTLASVGGQSAAVSVWDLRTGELLHKLPGWRDMARVVARGPDGLIAAASSRTAGRDPNLVRVWRLPAIEPLAEFVAESKTFDLAFLPDGTGLVTASLEVRLWDLRVADRELKGDRLFLEPPTMNRWFHACGTCPDGTRVAYGSLAAVELLVAGHRGRAASWTTCGPRCTQSPSTRPAASWRSRSGTRSGCTTWKRPAAGSNWSATRGWYGRWRTPRTGRGW